MLAKLGHHEGRSSMAAGFSSKYVHKKETIAAGAGTSPNSALIPDAKTSPSVIA